MDKQVIIKFVSENSIGKNSVVSVTINENGIENTYKAKIEFNSKSELAITNERIGMRLERIKDTLEATLLESILFEDILNINVL